MCFTAQHNTATVPIHLAIARQYRYALTSDSTSITESTQTARLLCAAH